MPHVVQHDLTGASQSVGGGAGGQGLKGDKTANATESQFPGSDLPSCIVEAPPCPQAAATVSTSNTCRGKGDEIRFSSANKRKKLL